ncbi:MAG: hypothetical protein OXU20_11705 [Myxococcales bacterium]|nr:hypothetical protein [Myxococcales bacterium]
MSSADEDWKIERRFPVLRRDAPGIWLGPLCIGWAILLVVRTDSSSWLAGGLLLGLVGMTLVVASWNPCVVVGPSGIRLPHLFTSIAATDVKAVRARVFFKGREVGPLVILRSGRFLRVNCRRKAEFVAAVERMVHNVEQTNAGHPPSSCP